MLNKEFKINQIKFDYNKSSYIEAYISNSSVLMISIVKDDGICFPFIKCKDYLQEFFMLESNKIENGCLQKFGFTWKFSNIIQDGKVTFVFKPNNLDIDFNKSKGPLKYLLYNYAKKLKLTSKFHIEVNNKLLFVTVYEDWFSKPSLVSLLIVLIRYGVFLDINTTIPSKIVSNALKKVGNNKTGDYTEQMSNFYLKLFTQIKNSKIHTDMLPNWPNYEKINVSQLHSYSGVYNTFIKDEELQKIVS